MKTLLISGNTLQEWNVEEIISNKIKSTKEQVEQIQIYNYEDKMRVRDFYESSYLNLEYNKSI
jgi:hypothetical protein